MTSVLELPVRRSIVVAAPVHEAFHVFTTEVDVWWPRSHHIGKAPMKRVIIESKVGGRCYTEHVDGSEADWGRVLEWVPPHRLLLAWQITHQWGYQPDLTRASEVEVRFTTAGPSSTRVDLEHRHFERHGTGGLEMREKVDAPSGWTTITALYTQCIAGRPDGGES